MSKNIFEIIWQRLFAQTTHRSLLNAFIIFIACVFLLQCLSIGYSYLLISNQFFEYQKKILEQAGMKLSSMIEKLAIAEKQAIYLINSSPLFRKDNPILLQSPDARDFEYDLRSIRRANNDIKEIHVILPETMHVLSSSVEHLNREILLSQHILKETAITDNVSHVSTTHGADYIGYLNDEIWTISFVRMIRNIEEYQKAAAIIQIDLDYASIEKVIRDITKDSTQFVYLINSHDQIMAAQEREFLGMYVGETNDIRFTGYIQEAGFYPLQNDILVSYQLEAINWHLVAHIEYMSMLGSILSSMSATILTLFATLLLLICLAIVFARKFSKPLQEMVQHMGKVAGNDFQPIRLSSGNADIKVLSDSYNAMLERISQLIISNQNQENERARAEYMAHMMQINPHFLYNTLDTMRSIALRDGVSSVADIARSMAIIFRYSIENKSEYTSLSNEIENAQNYIRIQQYRFGQNFEFFVDVSDMLRGMRVLKFILQPMVENAMEHGWTRRSNQSLVVVIRATQTNGDLVITIHDNGAGITDEKLQSIRERLQGIVRENDQQTRFGIGLTNIHSRIRYRYGNDYGLHITSKENIGTKVTIRFPCEIFREGNMHV